MRRIQHIGFVLLLGLWVLAGCQRENPGGAQESQDAPEQIVFGPARASLYLSVRGFGDSYTLTKADYVDVDQTLHYDYEKNLKDLRVLIFDASQVSEAWTSPTLPWPSSFWPISTATRRVSRPERPWMPSSPCSQPRG